MATISSFASEYIVEDSLQIVESSLQVNASTVIVTDSSVKIAGVIYKNL